MKNLRNLLFVSFLCFISFEIFSDPSFRIDSTSIIGTKSSNNIDIYLGVPFAEPPINDLRWEKPNPKHLIRINILQKNLHQHACKDQEL